MDREIKFRAWDKVAKKMWYDVWFDLAHIYAESNDPEKPFMMPRKMIGELMQCTGLSDEDGEELYEGDIVEIKYQEKNPAGMSDDQWYTTKEEVKYIEKNGGFSPFYFRNEWEITGNRVKKLGNKFENPELMEVSNEGNK